VIFFPNENIRFNILYSLESSYLVDMNEFEDKNKQLRKDIKNRDWYNAAFHSYALAQYAKDIRANPSDALYFYVNALRFFYLFHQYNVDKKSFAYEEIKNIIDEGLNIVEKSTVVPKQLVLDFENEAARMLISIEQVILNNNQRRWNENVNSRLTRLHEKMFKEKISNIKEFLSKAEMFNANKIDQSIIDDRLEITKIFNEHMNHLDASKDIDPKQLARVILQNYLDEANNRGGTIAIYEMCEGLARLMLVEKIPEKKVLKALVHLKKRGFIGDIKLNDLGQSVVDFNSPELDNDQQSLVSLALKNGGDLTIPLISSSLDWVLGRIKSALNRLQETNFLAHYRTVLDGDRWRLKGF